MLSGDANLTNEIRWVHVVEGRYLASLIHGGELLLTHGMSLGCGDAELDTFSNELAERRVAGLVIELGPVLKATPPGLIKACLRNAIPLVELSAPVRFVDITEAIHTSIVNYDYDATRRILAFQEALTASLARGAGHRELLMTAAHELGRPVFLEHDGGGIDYGFPPSCTEREARFAWQAYTHQSDGEVTATEAEVEARDGSPAGRLVVLNTAGMPLQSDRVALKALATHVAIVDSRNPLEHSHQRPRDGGILAALVDGRLDATDALEFDLSLQLSSEASLGVPVVIRRARRSQGNPVAEEDRAWQSLWRDVVRELRSHRTNVLIGPDRLTAPTYAVLGMRSPDERAPAAEEFSEIIAAAAERRMGDSGAAVVCVGPPAYTWDGIISGLRTALDVMPGALSGPAKLWHDAMLLDLEHLFWVVRDHPKYVRFAHHRVSALRVYDATNNTRLFETLCEFLRCGGHKSVTARALKIERQSLYYRISRIESVLGVDLADAETLLGLNIAVRVAAYIDDSEAEKFMVGNGPTLRNWAARAR
ncbi:PucR family transcriptional regulator [Pseudonocardia kujensis]|nr:PucR family transcriptional regulator [Pseudonocardia kujensis]